MTLQTKTRQPRAPRRAALALAMTIPAIALTACTTATNDARWYGSTAVTQPQGSSHAGYHAPTPILPGPLASKNNSFWNARRDAELGGHAPAAATATTEWPTQPRPNEQIFRFRTLKRN